MKKIILLLFVLTLHACSKSILTPPSHTPVFSTTVRPPYLQEGDSVAIISISSKITLESDSCEALINKVRAWGLKVCLGETMSGKADGWFTASDKERANDLQSMINNPNIKAILFFRGGYGAMRALNHVDLLPLRKQPKWLAGYSDLTAVHYALQKIKVESIHSTMPGSFSPDPEMSDSSEISLRKALWGEISEYRIQPHPLNHSGKAEGILIGGNLTSIESMNGTPLDSDIREPSILLIEDVSESISRIDRMLQTLQLSGKLNTLKGIIVGHFTDISDEERWGKGALELIKEYTDPLGIPVLFGFPAGHESPNYSLYMGRKVRLTVDKEQGVLTFLEY